MYVKKIHLENIRCFSNFVVEVHNKGSSLLILGDNGEGKSTVLRSLAMGLCDESSAAALFRELPGEFVRRPPGKPHVPEGDFGTICIDLEHEEDGEIQEYRIKTKITAGKIFERVSQKSKHSGLYKLIKDGTSVIEEQIKEKDFPWDKFFVSGYGAGSRSQGISDYRYYLPVDAVYPIFNYSVSLQNPELAVRRLIDASHKAAHNLEEQRFRESEILGKVKSLLAPVLGLDGEDSVEITSNAIVVKGHWGTAELAELGDGYRASVTWILDLLSWWFLYYFAPEDADKEFDDMVRTTWKDFLQEEPRGIVIIDEIDQHLHPKWQHTILKSLISAFPEIQFIATTHSPMTVVGTTDVDESKLSLLVLKDREGGVNAEPGWRPEGMRADQVLTSDMFRLITASDNAIKRDVAEYAQLASKQRRSQEEDRKMRDLRQKLDTILGSRETELENAVRNAPRSVLDPKTYPMDAQNYEIRRQIQELLGGTP